jgi:hypothetical protein
MIARCLLAVLVVLVPVGLTMVGCEPSVVYPPIRAPLVCTLGDRDNPCVVCAKSNCCAESSACEADSRCKALTRCARNLGPFSDCISEDWIGPPNDLYRTERACLSEHCPNVCPKEHGGPAP